MKLLERLRFEHFVVLGGIVALLAAGLLFGRRPASPDEREEELLQGHSRAPSRSGTLALAKLLQSQRADVVRWERRLDLLGPGERVLFCIAASEEIDAEEAAGLRRWISAGGTFIWMPLAVHGPEAALLRELGMVWVAPKDGAAAATVAINASAVDRRLDRAYQAEFARGSRLRQATASPTHAVPLGADADGWVAALSRIGAGRAIVLAEPRPARNDALLQADHAALLTYLALACADGGAVAFDEYHHGYREGQGPLAYVMDTPAGGVLVHLAILGFLVVLGTGRRLGPPREVHEERRRRPAEFIEAFARLCRASRASGLAVELALGDVTEALQRRFGGADRTTVEREAARRGLNPKKAVQTLEWARSASRARPVAGELVRCLRDLEQLRRALVVSKER